MYNSIFGNIKKNYILLFGFCGLLLWHNITFIIMVGVYALYLIINCEILVKEHYRLKSILLITLLALLITSFFTIPMIEQLFSERYNMIGYFGTSSLKNLALSIREIFDFRTDKTKYLCDSLGPFILYLPLLLIVVNKKSKNILFFTLLGYKMILMTTQLFPLFLWSLFKIFSFMQFPTRLLVPAVSLLSISVGYVIVQ